MELPITPVPAFENPLASQTRRSAALDLLVQKNSPSCRALQRPLLGWEPVGA